MKPFFADTVPTSSAGRARRAGDGKRRSLRRFALAAVLAVPMFAGLPARANPLVCATATYSVLEGPTNYVVNNQCFVPTPWGTAGGSGPECVTVVPVAKVCYTLVVSGP